MTHPVIIASLMSASILNIASQSLQNGDFKITVTGIRNSNGEINFNLYNNAEGFPKEEKKVIKHLRSKINNGACSVVFENIPFGKYAVAVYHDENNNKKLDKNFFGIPTEGTAVSNNAKGNFAPPSFDAATFDFDSQTKELSITMNYSYSH
jgi:uncharacterized protein (DUF2141 family)